MTSLIQAAISIAVEAHAPVPDKLGHPSILHPMRVLDAVVKAGHSTAMQATAVLHDVLEDTHYTAPMLLAAFRERLPKQGYDQLDACEVVRSVQLLTHAPNLPYLGHLAQLKPNHLARTVKLADIEDNAQPARIDFDGPEGLERRTRKYAQGRRFLLSDHTTVDTFLVAKENADLA